MYDGTYKTFERMERKGSVQIIPVVDGKIATIMELQPGYRSWKHGMVGGRMDRDWESALTTAKRELLEETGMVARRWRLLKTVRFPVNNLKWDLYIFAALNCKKIKEQKLDGGEKIKLKLVDFDGLMRLGCGTGFGLGAYFMEINSSREKRKELKRTLGL